METVLSVLGKVYNHTYNRPKQQQSTKLPRIIYVCHTCSSRFFEVTNFEKHITLYHSNNRLTLNTAELIYYDE